MKYTSSKSKKKKKCHLWLLKEHILSAVAFLSKTFQYLLFEICDVKNLKYYKKFMSSLLQHFCDKIILQVLVDILSRITCTET